jgi:hypothetical protein
MEPSPVPTAEPVPVAPERPWWLRRLCSQNPFYLLSSACVVHSTGLSLYGAEQEIPPPLMLALVAGYVAFLAAVGYLIVRLWKVWDDARSIFVILLFLFVVLAVVADSTLLTGTQTGAWMLAGGLGVAVLVTEFLLWGLRMPLPPRYRAPFYAQLALVFLYPLWLIDPIRAGAGDVIPWRLFAFSLASAGTILTLLPAVRRGRLPIRESGVLWPWPWYPWTIFVFFGECLVIRHYTLCLSFDPVSRLNAVAAYERMEHIFAPYFVVPIVLAAAVLVLEAGLVSGRRGVQWLALQLPLLCLPLALPGRTGNAAYVDFVERFTSRLGSPLWVTLLALTLFYVVGAFRRVAGAERRAILCLLATAFVGPEALHWLDVVTALRTGADPRLLWLLAGLLLGIACARGHSRWWLEGSVYTVLAAAMSGWFDGLDFSRTVVAAHALTVAVVAIAALRRDPLALWLRGVAAVLLFAGPLAACLRAAEGFEPAWLPLAYIGAATLAAAWLGWRLPHRLCLYAAALNVVLAYGTSFLQLYTYLERAVRWAGLPTFAIGIALLHVGLLISATKGGGLRAARLRIAGIAARRR